MTFRISLLLTLTTLLLAPNFSTAQSKPHTNESMIWIEAIESVKFNKRFSTTLLWHHRIFFDRENTYQDIYWASGNMKVGKNFTLTAGVIYFKYHRMTGGNYLSVPETRPFQAATYKTNIGKTKMAFRFMLEERYLSKVDEGKIMEGHNFNIRFRNRLSFFIPLHDKLSLELSDELIFNGQQMNVDVFAQSRARARLHYKIGKFSVNAGYLHWLVNTKKAFQHRNSLMVGVKHKFSL